MSGFLQRITSSAIRRQSSLHPLVESAYAPARRDEAPVMQLAEETQRIATRAQESPAGWTAQRGPAPRKASMQPPHSGESAQKMSERRSGEMQERDSAHTAALHAQRNEDARKPEKPVVHPEEREAFQPLLGQSAKFRRESEATTPERGIADFAIESGAMDGTSRSSPSAVDSIVARRAWSYEPLIALGAPVPSQSADSVPTEPPHESRLAASPLQPSQRGAVEQAAQRRAQWMKAPIQPEDIQIHIGRIEVIAAPPPTAQPAAKTARRGQSLDEYLSRSNGRSR